MAEFVDVEPKLKYDRMKNNFSDVISNDAISCITIHEKFLVIGTHWGNIHVMDHGGNLIEWHSRNQSPHATTVNELSIDASGEYIASCSDDGRVLISELYQSDVDFRVNFDRPVKSVAITPKYSKTNKKFVTGTDKLVLHDKGFLNRHKTTVLHEGEGIIHRISWQSDFVIYANELGVKVFDMNTRERITFVPRENANLYRADLYPCYITWLDRKTFAFAWVNDVKVCSIGERDPEEAARKALPLRLVQITSSFTVSEFVFCGLCPYGANLLALTLDASQNFVTSGGEVPTKSAKPHLRIIEPLNGAYDEFSDDILGVRGYEKYLPFNYRLEGIREEQVFYVVSPKDIIVAVPCDRDDHITWLLDHGKYEEAMYETDRGKDLVKSHTLESVGRQYIDYLTAKGEFNKAAKLCVRVLGNNKRLWETYLRFFADLKHLPAIACYIPTDKPRLDRRAYQAVLDWYVLNDPAELKKFLTSWPTELYDAETVVSNVLDRYDTERENTSLLECLASLYVAQKQYDKALSLFIRLRHPDVFTLIHKYKLLGTVKDKIAILMKFDSKSATELLLNNTDVVEPSHVAKQLSQEPKFLYYYLDALFVQNPRASQPFHNDLIRLYAEYKPERLLGFFRSGSSEYNLQDAFNECSARNLYSEMVFLLARMGKRKEALDLIMARIGNVEQAIDFCKEHDDPDLWDGLIDFSLDKPMFILGLLNNIGTFVDPIHLISRIQHGMEIPNLKNALVKILHDYQLQISLQEGYKKILTADCHALLTKATKTQSRAVKMSFIHSCGICGQTLMPRKLQQSSSIVIFMCYHGYHQACLDTYTSEQCFICMSGQRRTSTSA